MALMGTPITISSSNSKKYSDIISLGTSHSDSLRVPVSASTSSTRTLSNLQKVSNWIKSFDTNVCTIGDSSDYEDFDSEEDEMVVLRYDYNKTPEKAKGLPGKHSCTLRSHKHNDSHYMRPKNKVNFKSSIINMEKQNGTDNSYSNKGAEKSETSSMYEVPLSPESQKKELCSYLQLMNPLDKKDILVLQNRRSSRVRNLEKKEQEKKCRQLENDLLKDKYIPTLKSLKDLNIKIPLDTPPKHQEINQNMESKVVFPPLKKFLDTSHFDEMEHIISKFKEEITRNKSDAIKISANKKAKSNKNKENLRRMKRTENLRKINRVLRSTAKIIRLRNKKNKISNRFDEDRLKDTKGKRNKLRPPELESKGPSRNKRVAEDVQNEQSVKKKTLPNPIKLTETISSAEIREFMQRNCEIVTIQTDSEETLELNVIDDVDFSNLTEEHKRCLIESRILSSGMPQSPKSDQSRIFSPCYGFSKSEVEKVKNCEKRLSLEGEIDKISAATQPKQTDKTDIKEVESSVQPETNSLTILNDDIPNAEKESGYEDSDRSKSPSKVDHKESVLVPFCRKPGEVRSLHRSLLSKRKSTTSVELSPKCNYSSEKQKKSQHSIYIEKEDGPIMKAFYVDFNLIICQESQVSFYTQTALGNVLGAQNMWLPKGKARRLILSNKCIQKESNEMVVSTETNIAYVELWTKEHKSDVRASPVADVFITTYFWKQRQSGLDKKVLQLENINGFADDVQYSVLKFTPTIIVCWHSSNSELEKSKTYIHSYLLAEDYQTVASISELEPVNHYVSSLHNIEDCENLVMGCGENKITLWNLECGYIVATIELSDIKSPLCTLWVKCDRGFLFTLQQCVDKELRLIAINGISHSWKKLASYNPPKGYNRLKGVCADKGIIIAFYDKGTLCWNSQTGEPLVEEIQSEIDYIPSGNHIIMNVDGHIIVKYAIAHLISRDDTT